MSLFPDVSNSGVLPRTMCFRERDGDAPLCFFLFQIQAIENVGECCWEGNMWLQYPFLSVPHLKGNFCNLLGSFSVSPCATCLWKLAKNVSAYAGFAVSFEICPAPTGAEILKNPSPLLGRCGLESIGRCAQVRLPWGWAAACKPCQRLKAHSLAGSGSWQKDWGRFPAPKPCAAPSQHGHAPDCWQAALPFCLRPLSMCVARRGLFCQSEGIFFQVFVVFLAVKWPQGEVWGKGGDWFWSFRGWGQL